MLANSPIIDLPDDALSSRLQQFRAWRPLLECTTLSPEAALAIPSPHRLCWLCAQTGSCVRIVDVQSLKAHFRKDHAQERRLVEPGLQGALMAVPVQRPCQFCCVPASAFPCSRHTSPLACPVAFRLGHMVLDSSAEQQIRLAQWKSPKMPGPQCRRKHPRSKKRQPAYPAAVCGYSAPRCTWPLTREDTDNLSQEHLSRLTAQP